MLGRPEDARHAFVFQGIGFVEQHGSVDLAGGHRSRAYLRVEVGDLEITECQALALQEIAEGELPWAAAVQSQALAFEVLNAAHRRVARYYQVDVVAAATRYHQLARHLAGAGDDRGQVAAYGKVQAVVAEAFVDLRPGAGMRQGGPLQFHAAGGQLLFQPAFFNHPPRDAAEHRGATLGEGNNGDAHRRRWLGGQRSQAKEQAAQQGEGITPGIVHVQLQAKVLQARSEMHASMP